MYKRQVKNSGKTTLICRLLEIFKDKGLKVAVLKHDGHDFVPDVPGTDTYCQLPVSYTHLLGETAADTKVAVEKLKNTILLESEEENEKK